MVANKVGGMARCEINRSSDVKFWFDRYSTRELVLPQLADIKLVKANKYSSNHSQLGGLPGVADSAFHILAVLSVGNVTFCVLKYTPEISSLVSTLPTGIGHGAE